MDRGEFMQISPADLDARRPAREEDNRLHLLEMISRILEGGLDVHKVMDTVMGIVIEATGAERGFIVSMDDSEEMLFHFARNCDNERIEIPQSRICRELIQDVIRTGKPVALASAQSDEKYRSYESTQALKLQSVLCVPIRRDRKVIGVVYLDNRFATGHFGESDLQFVAVFARKVAIPIETSLRYHRVQKELSAKQKLLEERFHYHNIIGKSVPMQEVYRLLDKIVGTDLSVLIRGETGTGKELVAKAIHFSGPRKDKPFVAENCGAIAPTLLESELFGHVKGAFTGADRDKPGLLEQADAGTLFLDEIGNMSLEMQKSLLRTLQDGEVRRIGGKGSIRVNVRVIAASNQDLGALVAEKKFRDDLYYRLNVMTIILPPLRERREDIPLLVEHFLDKIAQETGAEQKSASIEAMKLMMAYDWPGNVRELENEIRVLHAFSGPVIGEKDILELRARRSPIQIPLDRWESSGEGRSLKLLVKQAVAAVEIDLIRKTLQSTRGNISRSASLLRVSELGLRKMLRRYNIDFAAYRPK